MPQPAATSLNSLRAIDGRYRTLLELGRGGTARVYLAKSRVSGLRKLVVLKTLEPELSTNPEMRELFLHEAETCARLNHPNIVQVHEVIDEPTGPVIVMEYLDGIALSQAILRSEGRLGKRLYLHAITQLLAGLHYFHELRDYDRVTPLNAVHRDVSPQNVILLYEGAVKVLDFGIAKLATETQATKTGIVKGKLHYMPTEQLMSDGRLDRRADIFATGVMLWEALAERRMWLGHTENTIIRALVTGEHPDLQEVAPGYPKFFYDIVSRAIAFEPSDRFSTALEMQLEVERILGALGGPVHPRELSAFMQTEFGEYRQQREAAIEAAIHESLPPAPLAGPHDGLSGSHSATTSMSSRSKALATELGRPKRRVFLFTVVLMLAIAALATPVVLNKRQQRLASIGQPASTQQALPGTVHFSVASTPAGAAVWLDGALVGVTPWVADIPSKTEPRTLELKADNFETVTKIILPRSDFAAEITLEPLPSAPKAVHEESERNRHARHPKQVASKATTSAPTPASPASPNCTPPYTLSADGIRTYKAECFSDGAH